LIFASLHSANPHGSTVAKWLKKLGDVAADEPLVELETDKVTVEVLALSAGVLGHPRAGWMTTVVGRCRQSPKRRRRIGAAAGRRCHAERCAAPGCSRAQPAPRTQSLRRWSPAARKIAEEYNPLQPPPRQRS
jgi:2-oxoglutarate dehydrogenase E2 component (dihydrolipoamide succinyltransferase)